MVYKLFAVFVLASLSALAQVEQPYRFNRDAAPQRTQAKPFTASDGAYWGSVGWLGMGHVADHLSSRNQLERNPVLRSGDGRYHQTRGLAVKTGVVAGLVIVQHLHGRRHPKDRKWWTVFNYAAGTAALVIASKNTRNR